MDHCDGLGSIGISLGTAETLQQRGANSFLGANMKTIPELFLEQVDAKPDAPSIYLKQQGEYRPLTWSDVHLDVRRYVANLLRVGVKPGDRVIQFSENRYEWILADLAIHMLGAVHVPVHSTLSGSQVIHQVVDSEAVLVLVSNAELLSKLASASEQLPRDVGLYAYEDVGEFNGRPVPSFDDNDVDLSVAAEMEQTVAERVNPDSYATILYTSGTTGEPKGVILSQRNIVSNSVGANDAIRQQPDDVRLNFLPLSHIFARTCDLYSWLVGGSQLALAESRDTVVADAQAIHPTIVNAVPYFYARLQKVLTEMGAADQPDAVRNLLGGRVRFCCSGGAPLTTPLYDYFQSQGLPLLQGYGLTESSPVISVSSLQHDRRGAVGRPITDVEVRIADDGEVLTRGPHVMVGYWKNAAATAETIRDGWLHTGDLGEIDDDGYLYITGRKKELIVTATGKNVAPAYVEALLVEDPVIAQALVIGDDRKFLTALIVPDPEALQRALNVDSLAESQAAMQQLIGERIAERLEEVAKHEQIGKFTILNRPFSADLGEMTPKLSLRRKVIEENFREEIEAMYSS